MSIIERVLNRLFKKREIVNCDHDIYLHRWFIYQGTRIGIYIHKFVRSDEDRALHDHPWNFLVIPLWRGYIEHNEQWDDGDGTRHGPAIKYINKTRVLPILGTRYRKAEYRHRVELLNKDLSASSLAATMAGLFNVKPECEQPAWSGSGASGRTTYSSTGTPGGRRSAND
jgi:hypothetical protein